MDSCRRAAAALEELALLSELAGENPFKVRALANAARAVLRFRRTRRGLCKGRTDRDPGIGKGIAGLIEETLAQGEPAALLELRSVLPPGLPGCCSSPALVQARAQPLAGARDHDRR